jgi:hypothetical protein
VARKIAPQAPGETPGERLAAFAKANACFFLKPYPWQDRLLAEIRLKNTVAAISANKLGKSCIVANIGISWCLGYEPWTQGYEGEDKIMVSGYSYRTSSLGIPPPVRIVVTGEDWKTHIGQTLVPEFKKWAPQNWYNTKKNEQGVEYIWDWFNKSVLMIMSYSQDDALFESFRAQGAIEDEPPPKSKHTALSRGLLLDNGKTLMSLTPLKEAWILDDIVLSGRRDIGVIKDLMITDNPDLYNSDLKVLGEMGLTKEQKQSFFDLLLYENKPKGKPVIDKGRGAEKYLEKICHYDLLKLMNGLKILKFIQDIDPSDVPPRVFGQFKSLVGRVLKEFEPDIHIVKPFEVPTDWPVVPMIDFHLSTPQMISYWAVNKQDVHYCIGEKWENINGDEVADDIIRRKNKFSWNIHDVYIDPLSKGDTAYMKNRIGSDLKDTYSIIEDKLAGHGITLHVASKDKDSGVKNLQSMLRGPNGLPTLYIFDTCDRFLYEVNRWVFDDEGKPIKENDHSMENAYRYSLVGNKYEEHVINPLPARLRTGTGSWMGA